MQQKWETNIMPFLADGLAAPFPPIASLMLLLHRRPWADSSNSPTRLPRPSLPAPVVTCDARIAFGHALSLRQGSPGSTQARPQGIILQATQSITHWGFQSGTVPAVVASNPTIVYEGTRRRLLLPLHASLGHLVSRDYSLCSRATQAAGVPCPPGKEWDLSVCSPRGSCCDLPHSFGQKASHTQT